MRVPGSLRAYLATALLAGLWGCQSAPRTGEPAAGTPAPFSSVDLLEDATAPLQATSGSRYPGLYTPDAFAVLMSRDMLLRRFEAEADLANLVPSRRFEERSALERLSEQFYVCELHLTSAFGDSSVAKDAVTLRGMRIYLADDSGRSILSAATHLDDDVSQTADGSKVSATNLVLFPKSDAPGASELIGPSTQRMTVSILGLDSRFDASWLLRPPTGH